MKESFVKKTGVRNWQDSLPLLSTAGSLRVVEAGATCLIGMMGTMDW